MPNDKTLPILTILVPCENALIDDRTQTLTINTVIEEVTFSDPPTGGDRKDVLVHLKWSIIVQWHNPEACIGSTFEQQINIKINSGKVVATHNSMYEARADRQRTTLHLDGIPIMEDGFVWIEASNKLLGSKTWRLAGRYPIKLVFVKGDENAE